MNEKHPIDELFKRGLADAEVAPPASVWEGIVAQQSWSERLLTSVRKYWWVPLLFIMFTGAGIGAANSFSSVNNATDSSEMNSSLPQEEIASVGFATTSSGSMISESTGEEIAISSVENLEMENTPDESQKSAASNPSSSRSSSVDRSQKLAKTDNTQNPNSPIIETGGAGTKDGLEAATTGKYVTHPYQVALVGSGQLTSRRGSIIDAAGVRRDNPFINAIPTRLSVRSTKVSNPLKGGTTRKGILTGSAGSIPPGDWWIGAGTGVSTLTTNYKGSPVALEAALNKGESGQYAVSFDFLGGRSWRNGLFLSAGIGMDAWTTSATFSESRQQSSYVDSVNIIGYDSTSQTPIYDTTTYWQTSTINGSVSGKNRYTIFRLPLTAGWVKELGRFEMGVQAGMIFEFDSGRKGYSLNSANQLSDSLLVSQFAVVDLEDALLNPRYGASISGTAGLLVGYKVNEFISVYASPEYSTRLSTLSRGNMGMMGERIGVRFSLRYTIPY